ncbi:hypothetical protein BU26DRAFT_265599 [Trematosphaeria pertusa]|uniref:Uncharacterized protein n=1 Tax=Trematosphaeria pertusa TaxID=390896 RepID=A0A6A6IKE0_9PLEO|nr:uncharacterized protein BU26DRAFT_265599 [Trematosphaeria pertusa]KAF2250548.1 hypothetical protein BU26DRAFT_265599 [Trematosphaeria pertusa]
MVSIAGVLVAVGCGAIVIWFCFSGSGQNTAQRDRHLLLQQHHHHQHAQSDNNNANPEDDEPNVDIPNDDTNSPLSGDDIPIDSASDATDAPSSAQPPRPSSQRSISPQPLLPKMFPTLRPTPIHHPASTDETPQAHNGHDEDLGGSRSPSPSPTEDDWENVSWPGSEDENATGEEAHGQGKVQGEKKKGFWGRGN